MERKRIVTLLAVATMGLTAVHAQSDFGLWGELNVEREVNKRLEIGGGIEIRRRDNLKEADRLSVGISASYKLTNWLKVNAGMSLLEDNRYKLNEKGTKYASYWATRYRFTAGLTASHSFGKLTLSLRERWQYTLRPEETTTRYWNYTDEEDDRYEGEVADEHTYGGKAKHVWRNRLQAKYKLTKMWRPYINAETHVSKGLEKIRCAAGTEIRLNKHHWLDVKYLYQHCPNDDDDEGDKHIIGIGYTYKF